MIPYMPAAILAVILAVVAVPAYGCETLLECKHAGVDSLIDFGVFAPTDTIDVGDGRETHVKIYGAVKTSSQKEIVVTIRSPDGSTVSHTGTSTNDGLFNIYHSITGERAIEGRHTVTAHYRDIDPGSDGPLTGIGSTEFHVNITGIKRGDITVEIRPGAGGSECAAAGNCFSTTKYETETGKTVEWWNKDAEKHRIQSNAIGYGTDPPAIIDKKLLKSPNFFTTDVIETGESELVTFTRAGTVLFACQFHPWMEAILIISGEDIVPPKDPPRTVEEIVRKEKPKVILDVSKRSLKLFDELVVKYTHPDGQKQTVIRLNDPAGNTILQTNPMGGTTGELEAIIQPSWPSGVYEITISYKDFVRKANVKIDTKSDISCVKNADASGCWAGKIEKIITGDRLVIGSETVVASVSKANENTAARTEQVCPVGTVAIVDIDSKLVADSRFDADVLSPADTDEKYAAIWCAGMDIPLNTYLLQQGLATVDTVGCVTSEFTDWSKCEIIEEVSEIAEEAAPEPVAAPEPENDCAIALAVAGTPLAKQAQILREYRQALYDDGWRPAFDAMHTAYYAVSPGIADMERASPEFRAAVGHFLTVPLHAAVIAGGILAS